MTIGTSTGVAVGFIVAVTIGASVATMTDFAAGTMADNSKEEATDAVAGDAWTVETGTDSAAALSASSGRRGWAHEPKGSNNEAPEQIKIVVPSCLFII